MITQMLWTCIRCESVPPIADEAGPLPKLMPLAMKGPGWNHAWDVIQKHAAAQVPWFQAWLEGASAILYWLRVGAHRQRFILWGTQHGIDMSSFKTRPPTFARWRWQTLSEATTWLDEHGDTISQLYNDRDVQLKDGARGKQIQACVPSVVFWERTKVLRQWAAYVNGLRTWAGACSCHEAQCIQASLKHGTFRCRFKGARLLEAPDKVTCAMEYMQVQAAACIARTDFEDGDLARVASLLWSSTVGQTRVRFGWLWELPWALMRCTTQEAARHWHQHYEARVAKYGDLARHRICDRYFAEHGDMYPDMRILLERGELTLRLRQDLAAYSGAPMDEAIIEGAHRDVSNCRAQARGSRVPFWASTQRLKSNLQFLESIQGDSQAYQQFIQCYQGYRALAQLDPAKEAKLQGSKLSRDGVVRLAYRVGAVSQTDWSFLSELADKHPRNLAIKGLPTTDLLDVKLDFVRSVFKPGSVFSIVYREEQAVAGQKC